MAATCPHPHIFRLFPHGTVVLLTDALILYQPKEALRIVRWFRQQQEQQNKLPGTWRLALGPSPYSWMKQIIELYKSTGINVFGCPKQVFCDILQEILLLSGLSNPVRGSISPHADLDRPHQDSQIVVPVTLQSIRNRQSWRTINDPISSNNDKLKVVPDREHISLNDEATMTWFNDWAALNAHKHRRFAIVLSPEPGFGPESIEPKVRAYQNRWNHTETMTAERYVKRNNVPSHEQLNAWYEERLRKSREQSKKLADERIGARRHEREVARKNLANVKGSVLCRRGTFQGRGPAPYQGLFAADAGEREGDRGVRDRYAERRRILNERIFLGL